MLKPPQSKHRLYQADIFVAPSKISGLGVYTAQPIAAGELVEQCPVLEIATDEPLTEDYRFTWLGKDALALGYGSLYNHSDTPNAEYQQDFDRGMLYIRAREPIKPGEEITVYYNDTWFQDRGRKPLKAYEATGEKIGGFTFSMPKLIDVVMLLIIVTVIVVIFTLP